MTCVALIDYGAGNLTSVRKALTAVGAEVCVPRAPGQLAGAAGIIVPGVGHFGATAALDAELVHDFFEGFARGARANVHLKVLYGRSSHHQVEALFKAFGRALRVACERDRRLARRLPSTKGLL